MSERWSQFVKKKRNIKTGTLFENQFSRPTLIRQTAIRTQTRITSLRARKGEAIAMHDVAAAAGWRWVTPTLAAVFRRRLCLVLPHSSRYLTGDSGHHQFLFLLVSSSTQAGFRLPAATTAVSLAVSGHYMEHRIGPKFQNYNSRTCLTTIPETLTLNDYKNNSWGIYYQSLSNPE